MAETERLLALLEQENHVLRCDLVYERKRVANLQANEYGLVHNIEEYKLHLGVERARAEKAEARLESLRQEGMDRDLIT